MDHIRRARPEDAARLAEIEVFDYRLYFYPIFRTDAYFFGELTVPALLEDYLIFPDKISRSLVYDDGIIKGFVRAGGNAIEKLFVEPAFRGMGIGGMLLDRAVEETGADRLLVLEKNPSAIRFYERHGFNVTDERVRVDDTEEMFIVMRREA
ncbi:MAG: GNAT family N-acetyltransferase [Clostridia bacterium]|nr:GNAT family N-acetyltransferase [Clostridia bacterium]